MRRGYYLFDLAETLRLVAHCQELGQYRDALLAGYARVSGVAGDVADLHVFVAAAFVNYLNWGFASGDAEFLHWTGFAVEMMRTFLA